MQHLAAPFGLNTLYTNAKQYLCRHTVDLRHQPHNVCLSDLFSFIASDSNWQERIGLCEFVLHAENNGWFQAKKAEHTNAILYPDHTFTDWQEADTTSWKREQYMMHRLVLSVPRCCNICAASVMLHQSCCISQSCCIGHAASVSHTA